MKKIIALVICFGLMVPVAQAGMFKKMLIAGAITYGAVAIAKNNEKQKKQQEAQQLKKVEKEKPSEVKDYSPNH